MNEVFDEFDYEPRVTYIFMYEQSGRRYIFNRSIDWVNSIGQGYIDLIEAICDDPEAKERAVNFMKSIKDDFAEFSIYNYNGRFKLLTTLGYENIQCEDQKEINKVKNELCKKYDATSRIDKFGKIEDDVNFYVLQIYRKKLMSWYSKIVKAGNSIRGTEKVIYNNLLSEIDDLNKYYKDRTKEIQNSIQKQEWYYVEKIISENLRNDMRNKEFKYIDYAINYLDDKEKLLLLLDNINKKLNDYERD